MAPTCAAYIIVFSVVMPLRFVGAQLHCSPVSIARHRTCPRQYPAMRRHGRQRYLQRMPHASLFYRYFRRESSSQHIAIFFFFPRACYALPLMLHTPYRNMPLRARNAHASVGQSNMSPPEQCYARHVNDRRCHDECYAKRTLFLRVVGFRFSPTCRPVICPVSARRFAPACSYVIKRFYGTSGDAVIFAELTSCV